MKKIPTLFVRVYDGHKIVDVTPEFTNDECKDAFLNGNATVKIDGSCCAIIGGELYKRYDAKKGKPIPEGAIKCQEEPDEITGHLPCWLKTKENDPSDKWFIAALNRFVEENGSPKDGTYEAIGKHFQGNPYNYDYDILVPHGTKIVELKERSFEYVKNFLKDFNQEGLVFWLGGKPVCKIKRTDFGLKWPIKN